MSNCSCYCYNKSLTCSIDKYDEYKNSWSKYNIKSKDDVNQLYRTQNQQVNISGAEADMSFAGRSQKNEATILWPWSASWQSVHTCSTWHHRQKQTSRKTSETLDRWHQTMDRNTVRCRLRSTYKRQQCMEILGVQVIGDLRSSDMTKDQGKAGLHFTTNFHITEQYKVFTSDRCPIHDLKLGNCLVLVVRVGPWNQQQIQPAAESTQYPLL